MNTKTPLLKTLLPVLAVLATSMCGMFVGSAHAQAQRMGIPGPKETAMPDKDVVIQMSRFNRLPVIELMIDETGPYRMIVDTGAAGVVLQPELAKKLGLKSPPGMPIDMQIQLKTPGGNVPGSIHYIENLEVGEASFRGVWTIATHLPFGDDLDGVIGMNIFKECLLTYDYPENKFVLGKGKLPEPNGKDVFAYTTPRMPDSHPFVELSINGKTSSTFIDSGFTGWFSIPGKNPENYKLLKGPVEAGAGKSVGKEKSHNMAAQIQATFQVGEFKIEDPIVILGTDYMIGTLFLENFAVTLDGQSKRMRLARKSSDPILQSPLRGLGFLLERTGTDMLVKYVHPQSDAAAKGLRVDDVVVEIDGKPVRDVYYSESLRESIQREAKVLVSYLTKEEGESLKTVEFEILQLLK